MSVIISRNISLGGGDGEDTSDNPRILAENVFTLGTVTASEEVGANNGWLENAVDGLTFDYWEVTTYPAWLEVTLTTARPVDMCAIGLHSGLDYVFQYWDGSAWVNLHTAVTATTTAVEVVIFDEVTATKFRIYITGAVGDKILGICMLGKSLQLPKRFYGGHGPVTLNRTSQIVRNTTEGGYDAGVYHMRTGAATSVEVTNMKPAWIRENIEALNRQLERQPFVFAWRPTTFPDDVAYCWLDAPIRAVNSGPKDLMSLQFDFHAFVGGDAIEDTRRKKIVVGGSTDDAYRSDDAVDFTLDEAVFPGALANLRGAAYAPELNTIVFCGGQSGDYGALTSTDGGVTFTRTLTTLNGITGGVAYSNTLGLFVIGGNGKVFTSADGAAWDEVSTPTGTWFDVAWDSTNEVFIAIKQASSGADGCIVSDDGETWTSKALPAGIVAYRLIEVGSGRMLGISTEPDDTGRVYYTSTGGESWSTIDMDIDPADSPFESTVATIAYHEGEGAIYCTLGGKVQQKIFKSLDNGATWTTAHTIGFNIFPYSMTYFPFFGKIVLTQFPATEKQLFVFDKDDIDYIDLDSSINWFKAI